MGGRGAGCWSFRGGGVKAGWMFGVQRVGGGGGTRDN